MSFLLQSTICISVFYGVYYFFLRGNNFFNLRRTYLILSLIASIVIPTIEIDWLKTTDHQLYFLGESIAAFEMSPALSRVENQPDQWDYILLIYWIGVTLSILKGVIGLIRIIRVISRGEVVLTDQGDHLIIDDHNFPNSSFFKYIFLDKDTQMDNKLQDYVLIHERKHIADLHFLDLIAFELATAFYWFNPVIYLYLREVKRIHEFVSDREVLRHKPAKDYKRLLMKMALDQSSLTLLSTFSKISIKTRLNMMNAKKSSKFEKFKFATIVPLILIMILAFNPVQSEKKSDKVFGMVSSEKGTGLPGVKVKIDGEDRGATDLMGNYEISLNKSDKVIEFEFPGFESLSTKIPNNGEVNATLTSGSIEVSDVEKPFNPSVEVIEESGRDYLMGSVVDLNGNPLQDVLVYVTKQKLKGKTDKNGKFKLELNQDSGRVVFAIKEQDGMVRRKVVSVEFAK